ncbi:unnamed protein product [Spirodela intermedia]|uniref:beta-ketoacyl-[acyl-carrier-protein] synthase I n=1 Tax=Spirodela intermedia TaxID=51605 RepID=A0A7I8IKM5_SPIIN|nr:unnamed protein product [Spirodela intermedia]CAA6658293.1 unnamed protein product [Spirodela intermedia]
MGVVSAFGTDVDCFYNKLLDGQSGVSLIDRFDTSSLPVKFAGQIRSFPEEERMDEKIISYLDPCWRYCLVAGTNALEHANLGPEVLKAMISARRRIQADIPIFIPCSVTNMGAALLASHLNLTGPAYSISTACSTGNSCLHAAANHIKEGEVEVMLAGGTDSPVLPCVIGGFSACRALSQRNSEPQRASRPWDKERDGFVLGEGSAALIMESLEHARKRGASIIVEYLGGALTCDAYHMTDPRPDGMGIYSCILKSLEDSGVSPEEVNYINAHATSTLAGDLIEVNAIKKVFKDTSEIKMNGTKSMIGHCLGAAGAIEAIATIKAITTSWLHPTINQDSQKSRLTQSQNQKQEHEVHVAISNSFGFGGQNSVVVFAPFIL